MSQDDGDGEIPEHLDALEQKTAVEAHLFPICVDLLDCRAAAGQ